MRAEQTSNAGSTGTAVPPPPSDAPDGYGWKWVPGEKKWVVVRLPANAPRQPRRDLAAGQSYSYDERNNKWVVVGVGTTAPRPANAAQSSFNPVTSQYEPVEAGTPPQPTMNLPAGYAWTWSVSLKKWTATQLPPVRTQPVEEVTPTAPATPVTQQPIIRRNETGGQNQPQLPAEAPVAIPVDWETAAQEMYGGYYALIKDNEDIKKLLMQAIAEKWSPNKFQYQLSQTKWWKETTAAARQWDMASGTDPATAQTRIDTQTAAIKATALSKGIYLTDQQLQKLAVDSLRLGFAENSFMVDQAIMSAALQTGRGVSSLRTGFIGSNIRDTAASYGIPMPESTLNELVARVAMGNETQESLEAQFRESAKVLYPALSSGFDRGLSFNQMTSPYAQMASQVLEIPATQIDFTDPKWAAAFTMRDDKGNQSMMSYGEWTDYLRSDPSFGWEYTDQAKGQVYSIALTLGEMFGRA